MYLPPALPELCAEGAPFSRTSTYETRRVAWLPLALLAALLCVGAAQSHAATLTVNTTADSSDAAGSCTSAGVCSLRDAITQASSGDTIQFSVTGTITLGSTLPIIQNTLTISGPGANQLTVDGGVGYTAFIVSSATATLNISGLTIANGSGTCGGSTIKAAGGICVIAGSLTVANSTFSGNSTASEGGAIYFQGTNLIVTGSTFLNNYSASIGGALAINTSSTSAMVNDTFSNNTAPYGGAIYNARATTTVTNSTFSGNTASGGNGGAIYISSGTVTANNNLFTDNLTTTGGGAGIYKSSGTANAIYNVYYHNLDKGTTEDDCALCTANTNFKSGDPKLLPLGYYGGPTETMLPGSGSAVICVANPADAVDASSNPLTTDQRGFPLSSANCSNSNVDAGAVQTDYLTVTTLQDATDASPDCTSGTGTTCSLRDAIGLANTATSSNRGGGDIAFASSLTSVSAPATITLASALPAIAGVVNIAGPGANQLTISGNNNSSVGSIFVINSGATATLDGLTISNGNAQGAGHASSGGGIFNGGTLSLLSSAVSNSSAGSHGGGVENGGGTLTVAGSTISRNNAGAAGGGIMNEANGTLVMTGSTVFGNTVTSGSGGGVDIANGAVIITNGTIAGNAQQGAGGTGAGGIAIYGTLTLANSIVAGNTDAAATASNILNSYSDQGGNVVGGSSDSTTNLVGGSGAAITLSSLESNGAGATLETMIPLPGSAAICAGKTSNISTGTTTDERGFPLTTPSYCTSGQIDSGAVQTNYTGVSFAVQPSYTAVNTAMTPSPAVEITETNTSTNTTDTVAGVPITLDYSGGSTELAGGAAGLTATTGATTIGGNTVNAAVYSLTPNSAGPDFTLSAGAGGTGIQVVSGTNLTATSYAFAVYGAAVSLHVNATTPVTAGGASTVTITAVDADGVTVLNDNSTVVNLTLTGQSTVLATIHLSGGTGSANVTLTSAGNVTLTAVDTVNNAISGVSNSITVAPASTPTQVVVSGFPSPVYAGVSQAGTVTIEDQYNNVETSYSGTVNVTTSESATAIPVTITSGVGTFTTSFASAAANQTITAIISPLVSVPETGITVNPVPSYVVSTTADDASGVPANCPNGGGGANCTLRDALAAAAATGTGKITFSSTVFATAQTINLGGALPAITGQANIAGPGANLLTVSGNNSASVFTINSGAQAVIEGLTITGGLGTNIGGGIDNRGTVTVRNCTITGNSATDGGGLENDAGTATVADSTISGNRAEYGGGGIFNLSGTLTVLDSTVSGNSAYSTYAAGGGIYNANGALTVQNSTISNNYAAGAGGGIFWNGSGTSAISNSILAGNRGPSATAGPDAFNQAGAFTDGGYNLIGMAGTGSGNTGFTASSTLTGTVAAPLNPNLSPLRNYGGPTQTMIPLPGSVAICAGSAANIPNGIATDQRGSPNTNTTYAGYSAATPCVDAGAVQTNYSLAFTAPVSNVIAQSAMSPAPASRWMKAASPSRPPRLPSP